MEGVRAPIIGSMHNIFFEPFDGSVLPALDMIILRLSSVEQCLHLLRHQKGSVERKLTTAKREIVLAVSQLSDQKNCFGRGYVCSLGQYAVVAYAFLNNAWKQLEWASHCGDVHLASVLKAATAFVVASRAYLETIHELYSALSSVNTNEMVCAVLRGDVILVGRLLHCGRDPNRVNERAVTPLHAAAFLGFHGLLDLLLSAGANVDCRDSHGRSPLHYAVLGGSERAILDLCLCSDVVNRADARKNTALHLAVPAVAAANGKLVFEKFCHVVQLLLWAGANPQLPNAFKVNAETMARILGLEEVGEAMAQVALAGCPDVLLSRVTFMPRNYCEVYEQSQPLDMEPPYEERQQWSLVVWCDYQGMGGYNEQVNCR